MAEPAGGWTKEDWDRYLMADRGYPLQGWELNKYYRTGHPFTPGQPHYPSYSAAPTQYPITPERLGGLVGDVRTRNWLQFLLSQMGFMAPGFPQPRYTMFAPPQRSPTMFMFPPYVGGY